MGGSIDYNHGSLRHSEKGLDESLDTGREVIDYNHQSRSHDHHERPQDHWGSGRPRSLSPPADDCLADDMESRNQRGMRESHDQRSMRELHDQRGMRESHDQRGMRESHDQRGMLNRGGNRWDSEDLSRPHHGESWETGGGSRSNWNDGAHKNWDEPPPHHLPVHRERGHRDMWEPPPPFPLPPGVPPWDRPPPPHWEGGPPVPNLMSWDGSRSAAPQWGEGHGNHPQRHGVPPWEGRGPPPPGPGMPPWKGRGSLPPGSGVPPWEEPSRPHPSGPGVPSWEGPPVPWDKLGPPPGFPLPPGGADHGVHRPPAPPPPPAIPYFDLPAGIMVSLVRVSVDTDTI